MSKQYKKESLGKVDGSISSDVVFTIPHSPEEEQNLQRLIERLQPLFMQPIQNAIEIFLEENIEISQGDIVQYINNYLTSYINTYVMGQVLKAGHGIRIVQNNISVRPGKGLEATVGDINVELDTDPGLEFDVDSAVGKLRVKDGDGIARDSNGTKVDLHSAITTNDGDGCGLKFTAADGSGKLQVAPKDFLYLG
jgi:hypothetical protein